MDDDRKVGETVGFAKFFSFDEVLAGETTAFWKHAVSLPVAQLHSYVTRSGGGDRRPGGGAGRFDRLWSACGL